MAAIRQPSQGEFQGPEFKSRLGAFKFPIGEVKVEGWLANAVVMHNQLSFLKKN